jgi:epoxyqueuosine reductase QueG
MEWLPGARSVVSYFLPFSLTVRRANRGQGMVAPEWVTARFDGEAFNNLLRAELAAWLRSAGGEAIVPPLTPRYAVTARRSNWSERHTAFIAGLGTFGLSKSMITERGSAGRFGSAITSLALPPSPRAYHGVYDRCPWLVDGRCGACIARCPSGAITAAGKDVAVCSHYLDNVIKPLFSPRYGCGKCQTAVPCEAGIPGAAIGILHNRDS